MPFGPLGADYRESESRKGSGKAAFAYRFVNCNEISVINQRFLNYFIFVSRVASPVYGIWIVRRYNIIQLSKNWRNDNEKKAFIRLQKH